MVALDQARRIVLARFRGRMDRMATLLAGISAPPEAVTARPDEAEEPGGIARGPAGATEPDRQQRRTG